MSKRKLATLIASVILALVAAGVERFADNSDKALSLTLSQGERERIGVRGEREYFQDSSPLRGEDIGGGEIYDTSRIWTKGPTGNAAENATHHFQKHGKEFGFKTEQDYVAAAVRFTSEPLLPNVITNLQRDDDKAFYNPKTAEYAVKSKKGFIRTYFKLNPKIHGYATNTEYFNAHAKVGAQPPANDNRSAD